MDEPLVKVEGVHKKFCRDLARSLRYGLADLGRELLGRPAAGVSLRQDEFWAIEGVDFQLGRGDCLGLIGRNGAGKSTLLKMLHGLIRPDRGRIGMRGRVGALIELGAGFSPVLTGRENIFVNGAIMGLTRRETAERLDAILEFSEIGDFIDMPVQNYSSGMKVRLGFAIAAQVRPDVLLIDEVLAVGDIGFKIRCLNHLDSILPGTAVIFVTHNIAQVERICNQLLVLEHGRALYNGRDVAAGLNVYHSLFRPEPGRIDGSGDAHLRAMRLCSNDGNSGDFGMLEVEPGRDLVVELGIDLDRAVPDLDVSILFQDRNRRTVAGVYSAGSTLPLLDAAGTIRLRVRVPALPLSPGPYAVSVRLAAGRDGAILFRQESACSLLVRSGRFHDFSPVHLPSEWSLTA